MNAKEKIHRIGQTLEGLGVKAGFTLLELLVVVSIIAMLTAILVPALSSARESAKGVCCASNLRQMTLAAQLYANNSNNHYPPAWVIHTGYSITWCGKYYKDNGVKYIDATKGPLWPYLQEKQIMRCYTGSLAQPAIKYAGSGEISGYGINWAFVAGDREVGGMAAYAHPARTGQIRRPGETILFADCARVKKGIHGEELFIYPLYKHNTTEKNYATFHFRHRGKANAAFCDGHADTVKPLELDPAGDGKCGWIANDLMDRN